MTIGSRTSPVAEQVAEDLVAAFGLGPFYGTPCGILAPLYQALEERTELLTIAREDNAVGVAAGAALAGGHPVVLMQNSGLGQSVNALASLVVPYRIPMLLVISVRGVSPDPTQENAAMGKLTEPLLASLGIEALTLTAAGQTAPLRRIVREERQPAALLVPPHAFGWRA